MRACSRVSGKDAERRTGRGQAPTAGVVPPAAEVPVLAPAVPDLAPVPQLRPIEALRGTNPAIDGTAEAMVPAVRFQGPVLSVIGRSVRVGAGEGTLQAVV
jgi:hypothetical protein